MDPPSKVFKKLADKNATNPPNRWSILPKTITTSWTLHKKISENLMDPFHEFSVHVHLS
jgi:hypothetical protein